MTNESMATGRIFLHYGSVLIALTASQPFVWDPQSGVRCGSSRPADSEFRIQSRHAGIGLETAVPSDFPGGNPAAQLAAFREAVASRSKLVLASDGAPATFTDRDGATIERVFGGDTRINGRRLAYEVLPLLENPWMRQEVDGNLTLTDGTTKRLYDVTNWTITATTNP
jgi:hypothetical protein